MDLNSVLCLDPRSSASSAALLYSGKRGIRSAQWPGTNPMNAEWRTRYDLAVTVARKAGDLARTYYESTFEVEHKADHSPVTVADKSAETLIRDAVSAAFPSDGFLGEEFGNQPGSSGFRWVI